MTNGIDEQELQDQNEQQQNTQGVVGNNIASNFARNAQGVAQNAGNLSNKLGSGAEKFQNKANAQKEIAKQNTGTKVGSKASVKAKQLEKKSEKLKKAAEKTKKVKEKAEKFAKIAAKIGKFITLAGVFLLVIMIIIGLIVFLIAGWGLLMSGFKELAQKFFDTCFNLLNGEEQNVKDDEIIGLMDNIESMGYDLYGYGFVLAKSENYKDDNGDYLFYTGGEPKENEEEEEGQEGEQEEEKIEETPKELIDELQDRNAYRNLVSYLISDNYAYLIKNNNFNFRSVITSGSSFLSGVFDQTAWGSGLISLYIQDGEGKITGLKKEAYGVSFGEGAGAVGAGAGLGAMAGTIIPVIGNAVGSAIGGTIGGIISIIQNYDEMTSEIKVDRANKVLNVSAIGVTHNLVMQYNLDGWIGRYSMPLEFLLATHIATMAPDLSYKLATSFNTDVEILLYKSKDSFSEAGIQTKTGDVITYEQAKSIAGNLFGTSWWANMSLSCSDAKKLFDEFRDKGIVSQTDSNSKYVCTGYAEVDTSNDAEYGSVVYDENEIINEYVNLYETLELDEIEECTYQGKKFSKDVFKEILGTDIKNFEGETMQLEDNSGLDQLEDGLYASSERLLYRAKEIPLKCEDVTKEHVLRCVVIREDKGENEENHDYIYTLQLWDRKVTENVTEGGDIIICSDERNTSSETCTNCRDYLRAIFSAMTTMDDDNFDIFVPYVNAVTDHWYRNVYFTKSAINEYNGDKGIIKPDEDYYMATGEMWTSYERTPEGFYELYVYFKDENGDYTGEFEKTDNKYIICQPTDKGKGEYKFATEGENRYIKQSGGDYKLVVLQDPESQDENTRYSDYSGTKPDEFKVGKKAITQELEDDWNAYGAPQFIEDANWEKVQINEDSADAIKKLSEDEFEDLTLVHRAGSFSMNQTEDGVRGETNPEIKKLFLDDYYLYNGSVGTASLIEAAKDAVADEIVNRAGRTITTPDGSYTIQSTGREGLQELIAKNNQLSLNLDVNYDVDDPDTYRLLLGDKKIEATYKGEPYQATIDGISGSVNILQNSLTAFSILKNMHTLDSEYIYHDFKELIVELDYFDKEDLIETERSVMMFPISGISSAGWPVTRYDKSEDFYGTLLHSKDDYDASKAELQVELAKAFATADDEEGSENEKQTFPGEDTGKDYTDSVATGYMTSEPCTDGSCNRIVNAYGTQFKQFVQGDYKALTNDGHSIAEGGCGICATAALLTGYGNDVDPEEIVRKKSELGLSWYPDNGQRPTNIQKIFESYGVPGEWKLPASSAELKTILEEAFRAGKPVIMRIRANGVGPWTSGGGHYFGVIGVDNGTLYTVDSAGRSNADRLVNTGGIDALIRSVSGCTRGVFVPNVAPNGSKVVSKTEEFQGFEGGDVVVVPVTGEVIKYGTVQRTNLETGKRDGQNGKDVGFIKIRVLGDIEAVPGAKEGCTYFGEEDDEKGYNYFWEEYSEAGITNHILYIEGFDVSEILKEVDKDSSIKGKNIEALSKYIESDEGKEDNEYTTKYEVPTLADEEKMKELKAEEKSKEEAKYTLTKDQKDGKHIYIKEGAVIGYTYTKEDAEEKGLTIEKEVEIVNPKASEEEQTETQEQDQTQAQSEPTTQITTEIAQQTGEEKKDEEEEKETQTFQVGNYLRIIFRDTDDQVVENVENYMEIDEPGEVATQTDKFSMIGTVFKKDEWVELTLAYTSKKKNAKPPFTVKKDLEKIYDMCKEKGINPEFIIAKAIQESGLHKDGGTGNFWGYGTPNGKGLASYGGWEPTLSKFLDTLVNYQNPTNEHYTKIMSRCQDRMNCTEWGGADPQGYGTPDTLEGISSIYSWLGNDHHATSAGGGRNVLFVSMEMGR